MVNPVLERLPLFGGLALLAIAFVIGAFAIGHGIRDKTRNDVISVAGSAKKRIVERRAERRADLDRDRFPQGKMTAPRPQLLAQATKDARSRARVTVDATASHLGKLRRVSVGVFQITSPNSTEVEEYGVYDTSTLEKDVTTVVNVTFSLK